jgi:hypothetical protein
MEAKGIPYHAVVKIKVGDKVYDILTDLRDMGTELR